MGSVEDVVELVLPDVDDATAVHDRITSGFPEQFEGVCEITPRV